MKQKDILILATPSGVMADNDVSEAQWPWTRSLHSWVMATPAVAASLAWEVGIFVTPLDK